MVRTLEAGPLTLFQHGTYVGIHVDPSHPEYPAFRRAQLEVVERIPGLVLDGRRRIAELAAPLHAFDVVFALWIYFGRARAETLRPYGEDGGPWIAEYVTHVLLDRESPRPLRQATPDELREGANPESFGELVREILPWLPIWFTHRQLPPGAETLDPWLELRSRLYMHRLLIRSFTYEGQERDTLHDLFDDFATELKQVLGFDVKQGLRLVQAVVELPMRGAQTRASTGRDFAKRLVQAVNDHRRGRQGTSDYDDDVLERLAAFEPAVAEQHINAMCAAWVWHAHGRDAAFSVDELAESADVDQAAAQRLLDAFSVGFGARSDRKRWAEDPRKAFGTEFETMREHPVVHDGEGLYLPCSSEVLFYGLRDKLTDALKADSKVFQRFDRHRARVLEQRALSALGSALKADWSYGGVKYWLETPDGAKAEGEVDGVVRADSLVVLVETKAGTLAPSARRTAPARLERGLRDLIEVAATQLDRSAQALPGGAATRMTVAGDSPLELDFNGVTRVLRVAVTLEDLSGLAPAAWRLQDAGVLPADETVPWIVGIHELELICELVERPAQLVHYVLRRLRGKRQRLWAMDEMDFFMRYLQNGLFWDDDELGPEGVELGNHTDPLDAWWYARQHDTKAPKRPAQKLSVPTRHLLDDIEGTGGPTRLEAQLMLLELADSARKRVASGLRRVRTKTEQDGKPHDMTLVVEDDMAITVAAVPFADRHGVGQMLADYGSFKADQLNLRRWLGLGAVANSKHRLDAMVVIIDPSRLDDPEGNCARDRAEAP